MKQMESGKRSIQIKVDVRISVVKLLHAKWIVKCYHYARSKHEFTMNGWKESGIMEHLKKDPLIGPFFLLSIILLINGKKENY